MLLTLHLLALGIWIGVVGAEFAIEFDGVQHRKPIEYFGGQETFELLQKHDRMKDEYCEKNDIFYEERTLDVKGLAEKIPFCSETFCNSILNLF